MGQTFRLAMIVGSVRKGRFAPVVAEWFVRQVAQREDIVLDVLDLGESGAGVLPHRFGQRIEAADAVVVLVPEYNHSFPGAVKDAFDAVHEPWWAKPVGFVTYGGIAGGVRAAEQLRLVACELHMVPVRDAVSLHSARAAFDASGEPVDPGVNAAAKVLLDRLAWWAHALRSARAAVPYAA